MKKYVGPHIFVSRHLQAAWGSQAGGHRSQVPGLCLELQSKAEETPGVREITFLKSL